MKDNIIEAFEEFCQKNNMKRTQQRYVVFEAVFRNCTHPSVEDIVRKVKAKMPMISTESIYRILGDFDRANFVTKMPMSNLMRYDSNVDKHSHFVCTKCNKIIDIYDLDVKLPPELADCKDVSFTINALCKECASA